MLEKIELSILETKIMLKLFESSLSKTTLHKAFWNMDKSEREESLKKLISSNLIETKLVPKPQIKKTPTYYSLTMEGQKWVENYIYSNKFIM